MEKDQELSEYLFTDKINHGQIVIDICEESFEASLASCTDKRMTLTGKNKSSKKWLAENVILLFTLLGVVLGIILGFSMRKLNMQKDTIMLISYPGELFMRLLKLMILPLVIASLVAGTASINAQMNGRIALRTFAYFASTSIFNSLLGISLVTLIRPGEQNREANGEFLLKNNNAVNMVDSLLDLGRNIFTDNIFQATFQQAHTVYVQKLNLYATNNTADEVTQDLVRTLEHRPNTNTMGIVFFCLLFGTLLGTIGSQGKVVVQFFTVVFDVIMKMVTCTMYLTPIGICSIISGKILEVDNLSVVVAQLSYFILTVAIGVAIYQFFVIQVLYLIVVKKNPLKFYIFLIQPMLTAFACASTAAALPLTFKVMEEKLRVDTRITRFVLPIGCNINMDGTALFLSVAAIFIAQLSSIHMGFAELMTVCLTSTAASMSSASVPSAALVLLIMVLTAIDVPLHNVTLLFAVDWIVDRIRTTNNMLGDCFAAAIVEKLSRKELAACEKDINYQDDPLLSDHTQL